MNKLILISGLLLSFSLFAQDALELDDSNVETNPDTEVTSQNDGIVPEEAPAIPAETTVEGEPEVVNEDTEAQVTPEETPNEELVENEKAEQPVVETTPVVATTPANVTQTDVDEPKRFNMRESHWFSQFGFEAMEYTLPYDYNGTKEQFSEEKRQLYGGRIGFGGELYLGAGFMTSSRVEGYYMGTLFEKAKTADPEEEDIDIAATKTTGQIYGVDAVQTLSFLWDFKTKNPFMDEWAYLYVEPFVEAGIGRAWAYNRKSYFYDTTIQEEYSQTFQDELTNARIGGGIKLTSRQGFYFYLMATQNRYDITNRRSKIKSQVDGDPAPTSSKFTDKDADLDAIMVYSLGGGYRF